MAENSVKRKLRAILCADVKGYHRLIGEDEAGTFHLLSFYPEIILSTKLEGEVNAIISINCSQIGR